MSAAPSRTRTLAFTAAALVGFAANSLLCRAALKPRAIDAASFTAIRILSGALVLSLIARFGARDRGRSALGGRWRSGVALFAYAIAFSFAYLRLAASDGALILFGSVQVTMLLAALRSGERLHARQWLGLSIAFGGLVVLNAPGLDAPDPLGAGLMAIAGVAWGTYSLFGRGAARPLADTAGNFVRAAPCALAAALLAHGEFHVEASGAALAAASGALASGLGYSLWYAALANLDAARAGVVQLCVPILTAVLGIALLGESASLRLVCCGAAVLAGVALATRPRRAPLRPN